MACRGSSTMAGNHGVGSLGMKQLDGAKLDGDGLFVTTLRKSRLAGDMPETIL
uniref:Uncharacterized protein n=1 Tax=Oryza sativa subsp. japonica TaxID=39947 RepID=Q338W2_ORYSJ|nr:hypothetical protein LOC_Os10g24080 [Oryza sativa Japonica Group]